MPEHCQALICCVLQKVTVPGSCIVSFEKSLLNPVKRPFVWNIPIFTTIGSPESPASREWLMEAVHWSSLQWWIARRHPKTLSTSWLVIFSPSPNIWLVASKGWWMIMQSFVGPRDFPTSNVCSFYPKEGASIIHFLEEFTGVASKQFTYSNQNITHVIGP